MVSLVKQGWHRHSVAQALLLVLSNLPCNKGRTDKSVCATGTLIIVSTLAPHLFFVPIVQRNLVHESHGIALRQLLAQPVHMLLLVLA